MSAPVHPVDIFHILTAQEKVLLGLRAGTGYADGTWNLPSGKMEVNEDAVAGVIRESREEIGIKLDRDDVRLVTTVHHRNAEGGARVGLFFTAVHDPDRHGEPFNAEPNKCADLAWFPLDALPDPTYPYTSAGLDAFQRHEPLRLDGWQ
jgi:8-oxo-dGTP pyrophosphatase MutT (NUDIX family)